MIDNVGIFVSVDVGGAQCCVRIWESLTSDDPIGERVFNVTRRLNTFDDLEVDLIRIFNAIRELEGEQDLEILGIDIGVAGKVSHDRTRLVMSGVLPHWVGYSIVGWMEHHFGCPIVLRSSLPKSVECSN